MASPSFAAAAARRAAQQRRQLAHLLVSTSGTPAARCSNSLPYHLPGIDVQSAGWQQIACASQQLICLRGLHGSSAAHGIPGAIPGTGGGSAEQHSGAGGSIGGLAESSTGTATLPGGVSAEADTGLGTPGQTGPAEAGTGLRDPTDSGVMEPQPDSSPDAVAERTASPKQPPSEAGSKPSSDAKPSGSDDHDQGASAAAAALGGPQPPGRDSDKNQQQDQNQPVREERADEEGFMEAAANCIGHITSKLSMKFIQSKLERDFNETEFLESAKDAAWIVTELFAQKDFETLRPMVSSSLLKALRETHEEYDKNNVQFTLVKQEITDAAVVDVLTMSRQAISSRDDAVPKDSPQPDSQPLSAPDGNPAVDPSRWSKLMKMNPLHDLWLVISVKFSGSQEFEMQDLKTGKVVASVGDRKSRRLRFYRGPLPAMELPVKSLEGLDWKVLDLDH